MSDGQSPDLPEEAELEQWLAFRGPDEPAESQTSRSRPDVVTLVALGLAAATVVLMVVLRPTGDTRQQVEQLSALGVPSQFHAADVVDVATAPCRHQDPR